MSDSVVALSEELRRLQAELECERKARREAEATTDKALRELKESQSAIDELKKSEQEFRRVWENSLDGMRLTNEDGIVLSVNSAFCRLLSKSAEELVGKPFSEIYEARHRQSSLDRHKERFASRDVQPLFERELRLWHGGRVWFELSNSFLEIAGQPAILLSIFRDITERKVAEEKLQDFAARLERSNRELQDFAYVASHDLQEPLRKVAVFSDRLKMKFGAALGDEGVDYIQRMQKATARMQTLITDLLSFSRVTSKAQSFVPVDLSEIISGVLADLETRIEQAGARVEVGALPTIEAEPLQMRQLFQNLLGNALKFNRPGEMPIVKIEGAIFRDARCYVEIDGTPRDMLRLTVSDNGIGFDQKYVGKIFQVFQRLHGRDAYEGTGMGLAITRKIVEYHGGEITANGRPGEGATFTVTLPVKNRKA
jgi:PAS domain S-box-containing protein